jgi:hypothetical protein
MRRIILGALLASLGLSACSFSSAVAIAPPGPPRDPGRVLVLAAEQVTRPTEVVGMVVAQDDGSDPRAALEELRRLAAGMGADAVVGVRLELGQGLMAGAAVHLSGTAVRYR